MIPRPRCSAAGGVTGRDNGMVAPSAFQRRLQHVPVHGSTSQRHASVVTRIEGQRRYRDLSQRCFPSIAARSGHAGSKRADQRAQSDRRRCRQLGGGGFSVSEKLCRRRRASVTSVRGRRQGCAVHPILPFLCPGAARAGKIGPPSPPRRWRGRWRGPGPLLCPPVPPPSVFKRTDGGCHD